ncbi:aminodeoxychorismate/anthranilate synthase component II [Vulcanimicrobium alpinum]|uniref:Aminodeoxychorismate/anthranilate synthase component II n=1 Tax=Vulcanimicrobium alpinum TaxID=3016050 RepID=A0AAN1XXI1_UNVUL|nr:aminodeoxychorismate/anthranilate synthase component II [Vulcanimicrobium alpinum]BDE06730.1 aminodeoxychorismate/anthranilate synthase component II [Vulcanimicrobium alpinum]
MNILLVDNYDSFTWNLAHLFGAIDGVDVDVVRNDDARLDDGVTLRYDGIVVGPGPGRPAEAGRTMAIVREAAAQRRPLFGVCLGLQAIGEAFGGRVVHAPRQMHGKVSAITHDGRGAFAGVPSPFHATRYHSLCVDHDGFPAELRANAASEDGVIQGLVHRDLPIWGVQFHPESVLTTEGKAIAENVVRSIRG